PYRSRNEVAAPCSSLLRLMSLVLLACSGCPRVADGEPRDNRGIGPCPDVASRPRWSRPTREASVGRRAPGLRSSLDDGPDREERHDGDDLAPEDDPVDVYRGSPRHLASPDL